MTGNQNSIHFGLRFGSSIALSFNWHILEPVVVQLGFLLVEFLRQKYIKRRRMSKIRENGNLEGKE